MGCSSAGRDENRLLKAVSFLDWRGAGVKPTKLQPVLAAGNERSGSRLKASSASGSASDAAEPLVCPGQLSRLASRCERAGPRLRFGQLRRSELPRKGRQQRLRATVASERCGKNPAVRCH